MCSKAKDVQHSFMYVLHVHIYSWIYRNQIPKLMSNDPISITSWPSCLSSTFLARSRTRKEKGQDVLLQKGTNYGITTATAGQFAILRNSPQWQLSQRFQEWQRKSSRIETLEGILSLFMNVMAIVSDENRSPAQLCRYDAGIGGHFVPPRGQYNISIEFFF